MALISYTEYSQNELIIFFCNFEYIKENYDSNYPESIAEVQNKVIENVKTFRRLNQIR